MDELKKALDDLAHLSRLALTGRPQDIQLYIRRLANRHKRTHPQLANQLTELLRESPTRASPLRKQNAAPLPVDLDSRLQLLRVEHISELDVEPIFRERVADALEQVVLERERLDELERAGLPPTKSLLFTGPPGVGKTLAARWLAQRLNLPLLTLDLSAVMSSFLGRTGNNVRAVLDYAKGQRSILLLDELDAIAKKRDDATEIGELKRLVTVLLQEFDDWTGDGLLIAATNHPRLLDPAVWRRFDNVIEFPMPSPEEIEQAVERFLDDVPKKTTWAKIIALVFSNRSFNDIERMLSHFRRAAVVSGDDVETHLLNLIRNEVGELPTSQRQQVASRLVGKRLATQRRAQQLTGVSRDTIRKSLKENTVNA